MNKCRNYGNYVLCKVFFLLRGMNCLVDVSAYLSKSINIPLSIIYYHYHDASSSFSLAKA